MGMHTKKGLDVTKPDYSFNDDTNTGIGSSAADNLGLIAGGSRMVNVTPTGVAIAGGRGTVTPITANVTLTTAQSGGTFNVQDVDLVVTLPSASTEGLEYTFVLEALALSGGTGFKVDIPGTDEMIGNGFTPAAGKGAVCTGATDRTGDSITVRSFVNSGGTPTWAIVALTGTWAREA